MASPGAGARPGGDARRRPLFAGGAGPRPGFAFPLIVAGAAALALVVAFVIPLPSFHISTAAPPPRQASALIPESRMPASIAEGVEHANDFVTRYPGDPRSHLFHAMHYLRQRDFADAEAEIRSAIPLVEAHGELLPADTVEELHLALAVTLVPQGRLQQAQVIAAPDCAWGMESPEFQELRRYLVDFKICPQNS